MHCSSNIFETNLSRHWDTGGVATKVMMKEATPNKFRGNTSRIPAEQRIKTTPASEGMKKRKNNSSTGLMKL